MNKNILKIFLPVVILAMIFSACGGGDNAGNVDSETVLTQAADLASQGLTQTAEAGPPAAEATETPTTLDPVASPTITQIPTNAFVASPTPTVGALETSTPDGNGVQATPTLKPILPTNTPVKNNNANCYRANFVNESAPYDHDLVLTTHRFTKRWTIKNVGTCSWGPEVQLHWIASTRDGKQIVTTFEAQSVQSPIAISIAPLEKLDISIVLKTPDKPGVYQLFWRLVGPNGRIMIDGTGDIWLLIEVYEP